MDYELRLPGRAPASFGTEEEAVAAVRQILLDDPDAEPEVFDAAGKPVAPGASKAWRDELKSRVGF